MVQRARWIMRQNMEQLRVVIWFRAWISSIFDRERRLLDRISNSTMDKGRSFCKSSLSAGCGIKGSLKIAYIELQFGE